MTTVLCVGHAVQDFVFSVPALPTAAVKHQATALASAGGGPAATAAVCIARLGGHARLAARVGDDAIADAIVAELEGYGIDCRDVRRFAGHGSSLSAVMVDPAGERMIVNHLDHSMPAGVDWLPSPQAVGAAAVLADSRWPEGAAHVLEAARVAGLPAVLDADQPVPRDGRTLAAATHVAFSADALAEFTGEADPARGLRKVSGDLPGWCCVTAGADGVYMAGARGLTQLTGYPVAVVDTLGAGDVWHGAFALGLAEGMDEHAAVRFAMATAALKVGRPGGRAGVPSRKEVEEFMRCRPEVLVRNIE